MVNWWDYLVSLRGPSEDMKDQVIENIYELAPHGYKVNVMFHKDYFKECVMLCEMLESEGVSYVPRPIGDDDPNDITSKMLGYTHEYNTEQHNTSKTILENATSHWADYVVEEELSRWMVLLTITFPITTLLGLNVSLITISSLSIVSFDRVWSHQTCGVNLDGEVSPPAASRDLTKLQTDSQRTLRKKTPHRHVS